MVAVRVPLHCGSTCNAWDAQGHSLPSGLGSSERQGVDLELPLRPCSTTQPPRQVPDRDREGTYAVYTIQGVIALQRHYPGVGGKQWRGAKPARCPGPSSASSNPRLANVLLLKEHSCPRTKLHLHKAASTPRSLGCTAPGVRPVLLRRPGRNGPVSLDVHQRRRPHRNQCPWRGAHLSGGNKRSQPLQSACIAGRGPGRWQVTGHACASALVCMACKQEGLAGAAALRCHAGLNVELAASHGVLATTPSPPCRSSTPIRPWAVSPRTKWVPCSQQPRHVSYAPPAAASRGTCSSPKGLSLVYCFCVPLAGPALRHACLQPGCSSPLPIEGQSAEQSRDQNDFCLWGRKREMERPLPGAAVVNLPFGPDTQAELNQMWL